jgi:hypothetical protein
LNNNQSTDEQRRKLTTRIAQEEQRISELDTELEQRRALVQRLKNGAPLGVSQAIGRSTLSSLPLLDELRTYCYEHQIEEIPALLAV